MPTHLPGQFFKGMTYPVIALFFLHRHRHLWNKALLPVLVNVVFFVGIFTWGWYASWPWIDAAGQYFETMADDGDVMRYVIRGLTLVVWVLLVPVVLAVTAALVMLFGQAVAAPFLDLLSEDVECASRGIAQPPATDWRRWRRILALLVTDALGGIVYLVALATPLFVLSFIPVVGALASLAAAAMLISHQFVGLPLSRQLFSYSDRWRFIMRHRWLCLGFGVAAVALLALPIVNLALLPLATIGGTLLYCDLERADQLNFYGPVAT